MRFFLPLLFCAAAVACGSRDQGGAASGTSAGQKSADSATPPGDTTPGGRKTILFVGTSLTAGFGLDPDVAYPAVIQRKIDSAALPYVVKNAGLSGETSAGALRRIDWLLRDSADVIVIETGANDGLRGMNPDSTRANIAAIIGNIRTRLPGATIVLAGMEAPPNLGADYTRRFRDLYAELAREQRTLLIPFLLQGVAGNAALNQADGIHPNEAGAQVVAETAWSVLQSVTGRNR